jgi:hypothetical protein
MPNLLMLLLLLPFIHASISLLPTSSVASFNSAVSYPAYALFRSASPSFQPSLFGRLVVESLDADCTASDTPATFTTLPANVPFTFILLSVQNSLEHGCHNLAQLYHEFGAKGYVQPILIFQGGEDNMYDTTGPYSTHGSELEEEFYSYAVHPSFGKDARVKLAATNEPVLAYIGFEEGAWNTMVESTGFKFLHWFFIALVRPCVLVDAC